MFYFKVLIIAFFDVIGITHAMYGVIWNQKKQDFVPILSLPGFANFSKKLLDKKNQSLIPDLDKFFKIGYLMVCIKKYSFCCF